MIAQFIKEISATYPFPTNEAMAADILTRYMSSYATVLPESDLVYPVLFKDSGGDVVGSPKKVAIVSYVDESGFLVREHLGNGFLGIAEFGAIDKRALTAQEVILFGDKEYFGVIGNKPSHYLTDEDRKAVAEVSKLFVDTGILEDKKLEKEIPIGSFAGLKGMFKELKNGTYVAHGLAGKIGSAAVLACMRILKAATNCQIYVFFVSKSAKGKGAVKAALKKYGIDEVIVIDTIAARKNEEKSESVLPAKGPVIQFGGSVDYPLTKKLYHTAKNKYGNVQTNFYNFDEENLAEYIFTANGGYPTVCIGIPLENKGMSFEICRHEDIVRTGALTANFLESL